jgi:hypothetical protein
MMRILQSAALFLFLINLVDTADAHHSYAGYDVDKLTSIKGEVVSYRYGNPHPVLVVRETTDDGVARTWTIEGISIMMWNRLKLPKDIAVPGENITVSGWPSRDGAAQMLLSTVVRETGEKIVLLEKVMQREAREAAGRDRRGTAPQR